MTEGGTEGIGGTEGMGVRSSKETMGAVSLIFDFDSADCECGFGGQRSRRGIFLQEL